MHFGRQLRRLRAAEVLPHRPVGQLLQPPAQPDHRLKPRQRPCSSLRRLGSERDIIIIERVIKRLNKRDIAHDHLILPKVKFEVLQDCIYRKCVLKIDFKSLVRIETNSPSSGHDNGEVTDDDVQLRNRNRSFRTRTSDTSS